MRRRLAAILAADIVGYSALIAEDEEGTLGAFKQLQRNFIEPLVNDHRGRIVKTLGDGFLIEFQSAVDAVTAAVAWQRGMPDTDASAGLRFRIGINLGDIVIDEDDIHGDGVNIATRLEGVSQPGGICVADVVYQSVVGKVETGFTDLGEVQLKNIRNGIRAWQWTEAMTALRHARSKLPDERDPVTELSIAVLPFDDMSSDPDQAYFCDGITEDLITELSLVPGLTIIARLSSFAYKNRSADAREIGRDLSVRNLVEGSVRRSGNRLRITAQLIETKNGRHLWAQKYDRELADVFAVQDDVVHQIVGALSDTLSLPIDRAESRAWPDNLEAYEYVVRGRQNLLSAQGHDRAKQYLEQAIKLDPSLSDAHAWLAVYYYTDWFLYNREPQRHMRQRILGPGLDRCVRRRKGGRHAGALQSLHRALSINPNEADALCLIQDAYTFDGEPEKGVESVRHAMRLNPHSPDWYLWHLGFALYCVRDYAGAIEELNKLREIAEPLRILAAAHARLGQIEEAQDVTRRFMQAFPDFSSAAWGDTQPFRNREDLEHVLEGYRIAGLPA